jgi:hypothetical protein
VQSVYELKRSELANSTVSVFAIVSLWFTVAVHVTPMRVLLVKLPVGLTSAGRPRQYLIVPEAARAGLHRIVPWS